MAPGLVQCQSLVRIRLLCQPLGWADGRHPFSLAWGAPRGQTLLPNAHGALRPASLSLWPKAGLCAGDAGVCGLGRETRARTLPHPWAQALSEEPFQNIILETKCNLRNQHPVNLTFRGNLDWMLPCGRCFTRIYSLNPTREAVLLFLRTDEDTAAPVFRTGPETVHLSVRRSGMVPGPTA